MIEKSAGAQSHDAMSLDEQGVQQIRMLEHLLSESLGELQSLETVDRGMRRLMDGLWELREKSSPSVWNAIKRMGWSHPVRDILHEDLFTRWSYLKPRGYPGDAHLMDIIYGETPSVREEVARCTPRGQLIYNWLITFTGAIGVRNRRDYLAATIDETARRMHRPHVLSIACGHVREAERSEAVRRGHVGRFVAFDQDLQSLRVVEQEYSPCGVEVMHGSVKDLVTGAIRLGGFDLVYSAGLFDYLKSSTARELFQLMFNMLNPGGRVIISNGLPTISDAGYMEVFADWRLLYRDLGQLRKISSRIPAHHIAEQREWAQETRHFAFLEVVKA